STMANARSSAAVGETAATALVTERSGAFVTGGLTMTLAEVQNTVNSWPFGAIEARKTCPPFAKADDANPLSRCRLRGPPMSCAVQVPSGQCLVCRRIW